MDHLENDGEGLDLSWEVRDGIVNHTWSMPQPSTLEAQVVRYADRIAYVNHDVDDAVRAGVLADSELPAEAIEVLGRTHSERANSLVADLVERSAGGAGTWVYPMTCSERWTSCADPRWRPEPCRGPPARPRGG